MKSRNIFDSFNYAISGIIYAIKTQRNLKIHSIAAIGALLFSLFFDFSKTELLLLVFTITLVIVCEMFNTVIEIVVDMVVDTYHPLAKIAKDVAAGAVLLSAINALVVAYVLFFSKPQVIYSLRSIFISVRKLSIHAGFISVLVVLIFVLAIKVYYGHKMPLKGGVVSGHSALAFAITTSFCFITDNAVVISLSILLSLMIAQSRVEGKIHTRLQVFMGAVLGISVTLFLFNLVKILL